ncbi:MAG TPA: hypothetical protein VN736_11690 [Candidatus Limnocylindrales bacterium]|nr:hypothetical protein [Candidatus Limnocylindrales bacterium]
MNTNPRDPYTPFALAACEKALLTLLTKIGAWGNQLVLIGGMTPRYLIGEPPPEIREHVGTTDLDVVVGVTLATEEGEIYRKLQQHLKDAGFAPAESFRWERRVDGVHVLLEFFCPVGDGEPGKLLRNPGGTGSQISAIRTRGAELAGQDYVIVPLRGELLDHGGFQEKVDLRVANFLPFIVLKAFAMNDRDKAKDSYDLVWTLTAYGDGPRSVADTAARSPAINHPEIPHAMRCLREHYQSTKHRGPSQYALFELTQENEDERERLRRFAYGSVQEFLARWKELGLPE